MLKIYNTLSRKKEVFKPRKNKKVEIFVCGPTTYDFSHLGHARTYVAFDMIVKYLRQKEFKVFYLQNITDIDDKIIKRAQEAKKTWKQIARKFEREYLKDMKALKVNAVTKYARATDHIKEIISQVKRLEEKGIGYQSKDGIYYDISKFKDYGKLSRRTVLQAEDAVSRIDQALEKRNKGDFCLWKKSKKDEPKWTPSAQHPTLIAGRPGWHIEDTAITEKYFGPQYDIHGGARDLIFPHHEAEIAQMETISGKSPMVKYWIHTGFLTINGKKMSKSLGNFITIKDFLKNHSPEVLRFIVFSSHYRSPLDYSEKLAKEAETNLIKIEEFLRRLKKVKGALKENNKKLIQNFKKNFLEATANDFNTPKAKGLMFDFISKINQQIDKQQISQKQSIEIYNFFKKFNEIFGFLDFEKIEQKETLPMQIQALIELRERYRRQKDWQKADGIRKKIHELGYKIKDTEEGPHVSQYTKRQK